MPFLRSKRAKITGLTDVITCPNTVRNKKRWTAFLVERTTGERIREINITGVDSSINSELAFDPLYLECGVYLLFYKVTMLTPNESEEEFSSKAETYIEIKRSPLVPQIFNGSISMMTIGPNNLLTLHPSIFSKDPDEINGQENVFDSVMMACRDMTLNETFPDMSVEVIPRNFSDLPPLHTNTGGCFQTGPGWFKYFNGFVSFWSEILTPEHTYEFKLVIRKDERENSSYAQVQVATADPPKFEMSFKIPHILKSSSDGKRFNPNMQLGMFANLVEPCPACTYQWELFAWDYQFCGDKYRCWRNLAYLGRYIEGKSYIV
ncbi:uncharacterized protein LOC132745054 [Ruditapes philippinarum]|uniref:uncharacterized protein LOC132745054 n=1 Tax=Ruditapes philippinarum TaxID=129788 RepID=UPI00295B0B2E|nr:uncharacterized protein LOC132745054 [Ruditapes philippinarum]